MDTINRSYVVFILKIHLWLQIELGCQCVIVLWCDTTHVCTNYTPNTMTDTLGPFYTCIVLKTCVLSGSCEIFNIKVCFQNSCSIPTEQTLQFVQKELQHLARQTLLMEHVAGGNVTCLYDITIYLLLLNFIWIGMKRSGKGVHWQTYLKPSFFSSSTF